ALERRDAGCGVGRLPRVGCLERSARALGLGERRGETRPLGALAPQRLVEAGARRRLGRQTVALGLERGDGLAKPVALGREALERRRPRPPSARRSRRVQPPPAPRAGGAPARASCGAPPRPARASARAHAPPRPVAPPPPPRRPAVPPTPRPAVAARCGARRRRSPPPPPS